MDVELQDESAELLQFLYACPVGLMKLSMSGEIEMINPRAMQLMAPLSPMGYVSNFFSLMEAYAPELRNLAERYPANEGTICESREIFVSPGARKRGEEARVLACTLVKLTATRLIATITDVSKQVIQAKRLSQAETWFASLVDEINDFAMLSLDANGMIIGVSESMYRQSGFPAEETLGRSLDVFAAQTEGSAAISVLEQIQLARREGWYLSEGWERRKAGEPYWAQRLISMRGDGGVKAPETPTYAVVIRDVTKHDSDTTTLIQMLRTDDLTGACNRPYFFEVAERECSRAERYRQAISVIAIDIDHFKNINDTFGHLAGDHVLQTFARVCMDMLRPDDIFARLGGEEFVILLPSTGLASAAQTAERIRVAVAATIFETAGKTLSVTASFGCMEMRVLRIR